MNLFKSNLIIKINERFIKGRTITDRWCAQSTMDGILIPSKHRVENASKISINERELYDLIGNWDRILEKDSFEFNPNKSPVKTIYPYIQDNTFSFYFVGGEKPFIVPIKYAKVLYSNKYIPKNINPFIKKYKKRNFIFNVILMILIIVALAPYFIPLMMIMAVLIWGISGAFGIIFGGRKDL